MMKINCKSLRFNSNRKAQTFERKEQKDIVWKIMPAMKYIEVIAYLQSKWSQMSETDKLTYELKSISYEESLNQLVQKKKRDSKKISPVVFK